MKLYEKAKAAGLTAHIVVDAGRTQIAAGSKTILAIGPGILYLLIPLLSYFFTSLFDSPE